MKSITPIRLTDMQAEFVRGVCAGRRPDDAARAAGFGGEAWQVASRLLHVPAVVAAIRTEINRLLTIEALPLAYRVLLDLAKDETVPAAVRRACARDLIDRAGIVPPKAQEAPGQGDKPLSEMSSEELRGLVDRLESELAGRAIPVDAQDNAQPGAKRLEFLS